MLKSQYFVKNRLHFLINKLRHLQANYNLKNIFKSFPVTSFVIRIFSPSSRATRFQDISPGHTSWITLYILIILSVYICAVYLSTSLLIFCNLEIFSIWKINVLLLNDCYLCFVIIILYNQCYHVVNMLGN